MAPARECGRTLVHFGSTRKHRGLLELPLAASRGGRLSPKSASYPQSEPDAKRWSQPVAAGPRTARRQSLSLQTRLQSFPAQAEQIAGEIGQFLPRQWFDEADGHQRGAGRFFVDIGNPDAHLLVLGCPQHQI